MDKKFIDAEMLKEEIEHNWDMQDLYLPIHFFDKVDEMPAADVQEVRHGKWIDTEPKYNYENHCAAHYQCSECGRRTGIKQTRTYKYCPRCGARMDGGE